MTGMEIPEELRGILRAGELGVAVDWLLDHGEESMSAGMVFVQMLGRRPGRQPGGSGWIWTSERPERWYATGLRPSLGSATSHYLPADVFRQLPGCYEWVDRKGLWVVYATNEEAVLAAAVAYGEWRIATLQLLRKCGGAARESDHGGESGG